jgi:large subunit ribosomal protein L30
MAETRHFEVRLARSGAGRSETQRLTLAGLGLSRFGRTVFLKDTPPIRGMLYKVVHLIHLVVRDGEAPALSSRAKARAAAASAGTDHSAAS